MSDTEHPKILIIEDDSATLETLRSDLARMGCRITIAETVESGIEFLSHDTYAAVFVDLCARRAGGRSVARYIKDHLQNTLCFIITGWKGDLDPRLLERDGISAILYKPLSFKQIRVIVTEQLGLVSPP